MPTVLSGLKLTVLGMPRFVKPVMGYRGTADGLLLPVLSRIRSLPLRTWLLVEEVKAFVTQSGTVSIMLAVERGFPGLPFPRCGSATTFASKQASHGAAASST